MTTTLVERKEKGERIEMLARVSDTGSRLGKNMGFETPFITFTLEDGREVMWNSDRANNCISAFWNRIGTEVAVCGFLYGHNLRRVTVTRGCSVWGMGGK
jgi:hypothetical protein